VRTLDVVTVNSVAFLLIMLTNGVFTYIVLNLTPRYKDSSVGRYRSMYVHIVIYNYLQDAVNDDYHCHTYYHM
jgi:uncharacterized membrane protein